MAQDYIQVLGKHLKDFSLEEQEALIEEISSHIESGEDDPKMGKTGDERKKKIMAELGSPQDMSGGFKAIYRNDRLIDYLFIAIPYLLYPFLNMLYMRLMPTYSWADIRLDILIHLPLVLIGMWRKSALLTLFWITTIATQIIAMLLITQGYYGSLQIAIWSLFVLGLLLLLGRILWQNRHDTLISAFGLLPLIMCFVGSTLAIIHPGTGTSHIYGPIDRLLLDVYVNVAGFGGGYLPFYGTLGTMALFFLVMNRNVRWLALGLYGLVMALSRDFLNLSDASQGLMNPPIYLFYVLVPLILIFLGWWLSQSGHQVQIAE
jgi:hypothetical protein